MWQIYRDRSGNLFLLALPEGMKDNCRPPLRSSRYDMTKTQYRALRSQERLHRTPRKKKPPSAFTYDARTKTRAPFTLKNRPGQKQALNDVPDFMQLAPYVCVLKPVV